MAVITVTRCLEFNNDDNGHSSSETLVSIYQTTRRSIRGDSHFHTHRRENLKSHQIMWGSTRCHFAVFT
jgi:hypothetical protein